MHPHLSKRGAAGEISPCTVLEFYDWFVKKNYPEVVAAQSKQKAMDLAANE